MPSTDREARGTALRGLQPDPLTTPTTSAATIVTQTTVTARERLKAQADLVRIATWLHRYAPLDLYYGQRRWAA